MACSPFHGAAQNLPQDTTIRTGVLANGLTYYIRHNAQTPKVADFYIAQRVGSILEEPHQRGLAHFLEHMAFNGTRHFPGTEARPGIVQWCESVGIKFGTNLNAYTSVDQTVYNISSAPVVRQGVVDSCLLILHDWSNALLLQDKEIDKERGVVHEEWRTRRAGMAMQRLMEASAGVIYKGTKYEDCMPIGSMEIIDHFAYDALRDYYKKWYRPDLQAVIVMGDIDVDAIEARIKQLFGAIPARQNAAERVYYPVNDNAQMIVFTAKDAEQPVTSFSLYMKRDVTPRNERLSVRSYEDDYKSRLVLTMLNERLDALQEQHSGELLSASADDGAFFISSTKDAFTVSGTLREHKYLSGIALITGEIERARKGGFTASELERAKAELLNTAQNNFNDADKTRNSMYVDMCLENFLENKPMLTPEVELHEAKRLNATLTLQAVNAAAQEMMSNRNQVLTLYTPDKADVVMPSNTELENTVLAAQAKHYAPYREQAVAKNFIAKLSKSGSIVKEEQSRYGYRQLTLSNGMRVYVKPTDFENDEVNIKAFSMGGKNLYAAEETPTLTYLIAGVMAGGIGQFDELSLNKMLSGKTVNITPYIGDDTEGVKGTSGVRNMKELFELMHLYFTAPRKDERAFARLMSTQREFLQNREVNPRVVYNDTLLSLVYGGNPRVAPVKKEQLGKVNYARMLQIYRERFANAADFDVIITGNIDMAVLKPLLCRYLASLPRTGKREAVSADAALPREVNETHRIALPQSTPTSSTTIIYNARLPYSVDNELRIDVLSSLLRMVYIEKIREDKGGAYGIGVSGSLSRYPFSQAILKIAFKTAPEKYESLIPIIYEELNAMATAGPSSASLNNVKAYLLKTYEQVLRTNDYWEEVMYNYLYNKVDFDTDYKARVEALTPADIQTTARQILQQQHRIEVTAVSE